MLKHLVVLAVIVASVWCSKPVPGQTANGGSQSAHDPKQQANTNKSPAKATITLIRKDCASDQFKDDGDCKDAENKERTVVISKLPPTNISIQKNADRDFFDWIAFVSGISLAGVGVWGILVALRGVKATEVSASAALKGAEAANSQIKMMKDKERARIAVNISDSSGTNIDEGVWPVKLAIANEGATHAFDTLLLVAYIVLPTPDLPATPPIKAQFLPSTIKTDTAYVTDLIHPDVKINEIVPEDIWEEKLFVHLRGLVAYKDVFDDGHGTDFHFVWRVQQKLVPDVGESIGFKIEFSSGWVRPGSHGNAAT